MFAALIFVTLGPAADYGDLGRWLLFFFTIGVLSMHVLMLMFMMTPHLTINSLLDNPIRFFGRYKWVTSVLSSRCFP